MHQEGLTQVVPLGFGVLVNVLLRETAEEDTVQAGVQPVQVEATHMTDARLRLKVRRENWEPGLLRDIRARRFRQAQLGRKWKPGFPLKVSPPKRSFP